MMDESLQNKHPSEQPALYKGTESRRNWCHRPTFQDPRWLDDVCWLLDECRAVVVGQREEREEGRELRRGHGAFYVDQLARVAASFLPRLFRQTGRGRSQGRSRWLLHGIA